MLDNLTLTNECTDDFTNVDVDYIRSVVETNTKNVYYVYYLLVIGQSVTAILLFVVAPIAMAKPN